MAYQNNLFNTKPSYPNLMYYKGQEITNLGQSFTIKDIGEIFTSLSDLKDRIDELEVEGKITQTYWEYFGVRIYLTDNGKFHPEITMAHTFDSLQKAYDFIDSNPNLWVLHYNL